jgi:uncharacterized protein YggU (UPF0235/DUF167 family)
MNSLLDEAIKRVKVLPESEQEKIALLIMKEVSEKKSNKKKGVLSRLKKIKIQAPEDFAENIDLYLNGNK